MDVKNLLTPESSPNKPALVEGVEKADFVASTYAAGKLGELQERATTNDEFDELIRNAKRKAREEEQAASNGNKRRRHSSRIQQKSQLPELYKEPSETPEPQSETSTSIESKSNMSQMKKVQHNSLFRQLNRLDNVKLCLECCVQVCGEHGKKAPRGSFVIFEKSFEDMEKTLVAAKQRYYQVKVEDNNVANVNAVESTVKTEVV